MAEQEAPAHVEGVRKGEEMVDEEGREPGRAQTGHDDTPAGRPHGTSDARDDTSIDPQEPISGTNPKG
jgi:hypothetical protein